MSEINRNIEINELSPRSRRSSSMSRVAAMAGRIPRGAGKYLLLILFALTWRETKGEVPIFGHLNQEWAARRGREADMYLVVAALFEVSQGIALWMSSGGNYRGKCRQAYVNCGRTLRIADSIQHHLLQSKETKEGCRK